ncbi:MAG: prepilin-type N-terminal cleavage/methylation domain-containing protein [Betaproteobacteria bacterium]|nr:prepilin-type N-terminal cleavage/methylation domain-containing protein [Betaproteobacteria bacterium]
MRKNPKRPRRTGGFTLLEVIIALALTSLVALLGAVLVRTATDHYARGNAFLDDQEQTRQIARLFKALGAGLADKQEEPVVGQPFLLELTSDKLPLGMNLPGRQKLRLQCEQNTETGGESGLSLVLRVIDTTAPVPGARQASAVAGPAASQADATGKKEVFKAIEVLGKNLKQCGFAYLRLASDKEGAAVGRWEEAWLETYGRRPLAIRLTVESARAAIPPFVIALTP